MPPPQAATRTALCHAAAALLIALALPATAAARCTLQARDIVGAWEARGGTGDFETFELSARGGTQRFSSWLHQRPEIVDADWSLRDCVLAVTPRRNEMPAFQYQVSMHQGRLHLREAPRRRAAVYARVRR